MAKKTSPRKKSTARRYAPLGLWLTGLSILVGIVVLAIKLLAVINIYTPTADKIKIINAVGLGALAAFVTGLAVFALLDPNRIQKFLSGHQARHGSSALITLIAVIGIIFVVNLFFYQNPMNWKNLDWTEDKSNTLAPETLNTLQALPSPVKAIGFFTANYSSASAEKLLNDYKNSSAGKFDFQIVNPENKPTLAAQYKVTRDGTIVLVMDNRQESITYASETEMTNALVRLMNPGQRIIYFLTGHGEADSQTSGNPSLTRVSAMLKAKNYTVETLNLRAENAIPADALAIIIAGPTAPISPEEAGLLKAYLDKGGSLVLLEHPTFYTNKGATPDALEVYLADTWGITFNNNLVIDPHSNYPDIAVSNIYGSHAITDKLQRNLNTFFPVARSITLSSGVANVTTTPLVFTIDKAWGETDFNSITEGKVTYDPGDLPGPLTLAAAAENSSTTARVVVFGNTDFAADTYVDQFGNADLIINSIDWAAKQESMINLTAKTPTNRTLLPISTFAWLMLGLTFILIVPGLIIAGGVASWLVRRSKG